MDRILEYEIPSEYDGANITTVLKQHFKISTNLIKDLKKYKEGIQVNGEHKRVVDFVAKGDILKITIRDTASENIVPTDIPLDIVYEDEDVLVINKLPNMPTHPSMGNYENSLANGVMYYYKSKGEERVFRADGQRAVTHYRVIKRYGEYTLLEMKLETGRTHQIRVHMAYIGHPLVGDWLYGTEDHNIAKRQMLHSCYLCFTHPITGQIMEFKDEMAEDMRAFIEKLS